MQVEFDHATAICRDCHQPINGRLVVKDDQFLSLRQFRGYGKGELVINCCIHHDDYRDAYRRQGIEEESPQHNIFTITSDDRVIGELGKVSSFAAEIFMKISDPKTQEFIAGLFASLTYSENYDG